MNMEQAEDRCRRFIMQVKHLGLVRLSALAGLLSAICWTIGDILIVGFKALPEAYPAIMRMPLLPDKDFAALMVTGDTARLAAGALFAVFSVPLMFFALYHIYKLMESGGKRFAALTVLALFLGFSWSPMTHAAFFYFGEAVKTALAVDAANAESVFAMAKSFSDVLYIVYIPAVGLTAIGWILASIAILRGKTAFPRWFGTITPFPASIFCILTVPLLPESFSTPLGGAGFNLGGIIFCTASCIFCFTKIQHWRLLPSV
jgi:hypothetical protein